MAMRILVAVAYVNHGRWVADCPFCSGAEEMATLPMSFFCHACQMAAVQGQAIPALFPAPAEAESIERVLAIRPVPNRNWVPGETVDQLRAENLEHGLGTGDQN